MRARKLALILLSKSLVVAITVFVILTLSAGAQNYPFPSKVGQPAAICTGCRSLNASGEPNDGKPTWQYDDPLFAFTGRVVDSQATQNIQHQGMRTLRAGIVRSAYSRRGDAPPRVYAYIGLATFGAYSLETFPKTLGSKMITVRDVAKRSVALRTSGPERVAKPDAVVYPEKDNSGWQVPFVDSAERLKDFDFDDRGYVYLAYDVFGFGIVRDTGQTGIAILPIVEGSQQIASLEGMQPDKIIAVKSGGRYYLAVSYMGNSLAGRRIFDVTDPAAPTLVSHTVGAATKQTVIRDWARDDGKGIVAVVANDGMLRIYTYDAYVQNKLPAHTLTSKTKFTSMVFDERGVLWVIETPAGAKGKTQVRRLVYEDGRLADTAYTPFPEWLEPVKIHARGGYLAAVGRVKRGNRSLTNGFLFKIDGDDLVNLSTGDFFLNYYHAAPKGFAQPAGYTSSPQDVHLLTTGGRTYLMYMVYGLGDVFEIKEAGDGGGGVDPDPPVDPAPCPCCVCPNGGIE